MYISVCLCACITQTYSRLILICVRLYIIESRLLISMYTVSQHALTSETLLPGAQRRDYCGTGRDTEIGT